MSAVNDCLVNLEIKSPKKESKKKSRRTPSVEIISRELGEIDDCSVIPEEIPETPPHYFLMRQTPPRDITDRRTTEYAKAEVCCEKCHRPKPSRSKSGRKIKGRGKMRYRTPSPSDERSGSETPPHWKQEQSRVCSIADVKNSGSEECGRAWDKKDWKVPWREDSWRTESHSYTGRFTLKPFLTGANTVARPGKEFTSSNKDGPEKDVKERASILASKKQNVDFSSPFFCKVVKDIKKQPKVVIRRSPIRRSPVRPLPPLPKVEVVKPKKEKTVSTMLLMNYIQDGSSEDSDEDSVQSAGNGSVNELERKENNQLSVKNCEFSERRKQPVELQLKKIGDRKQGHCEGKDKVVKSQTFTQVVKRKANVSDSQSILMNYFHQSSSDTDSEEQDQLDSTCNDASKSDSFNIPPCSVEEKRPFSSKPKQCDTSVSEKGFQKTKNTTKDSQNVVPECRDVPAVKPVKPKRQKTQEELLLSNYFNFGSSEEESDSEGSPDTAVPKLNLNRNIDASVPSNEQSTSAELRTHHPSPPPHKADVRDSRSSSPVSRVKFKQYREEIYEVKIGECDDAESSSYNEEEAGRRKSDESNKTPFQEAQPPKVPVPHRQCIANRRAHHYNTKHSGSSPDNEGPQAAKRLKCSPKSSMKKAEGKTELKHSPSKAIARQPRSNRQRKRHSSSHSRDRSISGSRHKNKSICIRRSVFYKEKSLVITRSRSRSRNRKRDLPPCKQRQQSPGRRRHNENQGCVGCHSRRSGKNGKKNSHSRAGSHSQRKTKQKGTRRTRSSSSSSSSSSSTCDTCSSSSSSSSSSGSSSSTSSSSSDTDGSNIPEKKDVKSHVKRTCFKRCSSSG